MAAIPGRLSLAEEWFREHSSGGYLVHASTADATAPLTAARATEERGRRGGTQRKEGGLSYCPTIALVFLLIPVPYRTTGVLLRPCTRPLTRLLASTAAAREESSAWGCWTMMTLMAVEERGNEIDPDLPVLDRSGIAPAASGAAAGLCARALKTLGLPKRPGGSSRLKVPGPRASAR